MLSRLPRLAPDLRFHALFRAPEFRDATWRDEGLGALPNLDASVIPCGPFSPKSQWVLPPLLRRLGASLFHSPNYLVPYLSFPREAAAAAAASPTSMTSSRSWWRTTRRTRARAV